MMNSEIGNVEKRVAPLKICVIWKAFFDDRFAKSRWHQTHCIIMTQTLDYNSLNIIICVAVLRATVKYLS